jgi:hypothetical protein
MSVDAIRTYNLEVISLILRLLDPIPGSNLNSAVTPYACIATVTPYACSAWPEYCSLQEACAATDDLAGVAGALSINRSRNMRTASEGPGPMRATVLAPVSGNASR